MLKKLFPAIAVLLVSFTAFSVPLELPSIFSDNMVLQRDMNVPVWGNADPGATVTVEFAGQKKMTVANAGGKWQVTLDPMEACAEPQTMIIKSSIDNQQSSFTNVLVGEVWLCSGQSNMQLFLRDTKDSDTEIAKADLPLIRLYQTPLKFSTIPEERIDTTWMACTPETVRKFSGVAYYFGKKLQQDLNVPMGLWQSAWGGTRIEPWTPLNGFKSVESLEDIYKLAQTVPKLSGNFRKDRQHPTWIYNAMIHANVPFAIRGVIWYQGEANHAEGMLYLKKTRALLNGWRDLWGYDFPYYFVQLAPYQYGEDDPLMLPEFWEAQAEIVKQIPHTGMAVITDTVSDLNDIHPPNKQIPGERLALLAEANTYGMNVICTGPTFEKMEITGDTIKVTFSSADGLTTRDGKAPDWFEISSDDGIFKPADAKISGNCVILSSPEIKNPAAMRFAWHKEAMPNLINGAGLPAPAFRSNN
ncbi:MAG: sialate O-acetylesterase [Kiritimatiellales bacterium]